MAIKDISRKPYIEDNDTNIKIGIDLPIRRDPLTGGFFASTSTTIEAVKNNIRNLLNTNKGERFFQPNLGLDLKKYLFSQVTGELQLQIQNDIVSVLESWLPFVEVQDIQLGSNENFNILTIKILFNIKQDPNTLDSVDLSITGDMNEQSGDTSTGGGGY
tara:strand:- start:214 stop:693 length:480 start_codon:yes stop_codon:yes gene_type:complete